MKRPIKTIKVKPAMRGDKQLRVLCPARQGQKPKVLPPEGAEVKCINSGEVRYWNRRIIDNDVVRLPKDAKVGKPVPAPGKEGAGSSKRLPNKPEGQARG